MTITYVAADNYTPLTNSSSLLLSRSLLPREHFIGGIDSGNTLTGRLSFVLLGIGRDSNIRVLVHCIFAVDLFDLCSIAWSIGWVESEEEKRIGGVGEGGWL